MCTVQWTLCGMPSLPTHKLALEIVADVEIESGRRAGRARSRSYRGARVTAVNLPLLFDVGATGISWVGIGAVYRQRDPREVAARCGRCGLRAVQQRTRELDKQQRESLWCLWPAMSPQEQKN